MSTPVARPTRYSVARYLALVDEGVLAADDTVELLDGLIVAEPPQNPPHAFSLGSVADALREAAAGRALVNVQLPLVAGEFSMPEPDVALIPGERRDYESTHPTRALLVVEVADSTLQQDRLTKAPIYAAAGVPEYWIVNLREECVEVFRKPVPQAGRYSEATRAVRGGRVGIAALPGASIAVADLLPSDPSKRL